jgi:hypothetical protein
MYEKYSAVINFIYNITIKSIIKKSNEEGMKMFRKKVRFIK